MTTLRPAVCVFLLLLGGTLPAAEEDVAAKKERLEELRDRIADVRERLRDQTARRREVTDALREVETRIGEIGAELRRTEQQIAGQEHRLEQLQSERAERRRELDRQKDNLSEQIRSAYRAGREERLKLLLNQEDPATLGRMLAYYDYLNRARTERIREVNHQIDELARVEREIRTTLESLEDLRRKRQQRLDGLAATRAEREAVLDRIEQSIRQTGSRLEEMKSDEQALAHLVRSLQRALSDIPADLGSKARFAEMKGQLPWPSTGSLMNAYGGPRAGGRLQWRGIRIAAEPGTAVRAVSHGRVAYADWLPRFGLLLVIEHSDGFMSLYGHNRSLFKEVGDWVEPGEIIASVGDSGGQQRSALYFEIRKGREPVDPVAWLRNRN